MGLSPYFIFAPWIGVVHNSYAARAVGVPRLADTINTIEQYEYRMSKETKNNESRKYARRRTSEYLVVTDRESGTRLGRVTNLSPKGLMMLSGDALTAECTYGLSIALPDGIFDKSNIELSAVCRWSRYEKQSDFWGNGLEIAAISDDDRKLLQQVVVKLMTNNGECGEIVDPEQKQKDEKIEWLRHRPYRRKEGV